MRSNDLSPTELAERFGVSVGTLANWRAQDKGPPFEKRGRVRNGRVTYPLRSAIRWGKDNGYLEEDQ